MEKRRNPVRRRALALALAAALSALGALTCTGAAACELPPGTRVESERRTRRPVHTDTTKQGRALPERVVLDAHMPEHRHGMNYRTKVTPRGAGRYSSEGWLFHMPGRWEVRFELGSERRTHSVHIE